MQQGSSKGDPHARQSKLAQGSALEDAGGGFELDVGHVPLAQQAGEHSSHPSSSQLHTSVAVHERVLLLWIGLDEVLDPMLVVGAE